MNLQRRISPPIAALCLTIAVGTPDAVHAEGRTAWMTEVYPYSVIDQALPDVLREFGLNLGMTVDVGDGVRGRVRHYDHEGEAVEFLQYLADEHGLDWVQDAGRIYVSARDRRVDRSWSGDHGVHEAVRTALRDSGVGDPRFPVGFDADRGELRLSAPSRYMTLAAPVIDRLLAPKATRAVNVIYGRSGGDGS